MTRIFTMLTIYFEDPFWVGVYQRIEDGKLEVSRVVFGAEPTDAQVYDYFQTHFTKMRFGPPTDDAESLNDKPKNPKRMQRDIKKHLLKKGIGTKAQNALKLQREQNKLEKTCTLRERSEEAKETKYLLRCKKRKEKHNGR